MSWLHEYTEEFELQHVGIDITSEEICSLSIDMDLKTKLQFETAKHFDQIIPFLASQTKNSADKTKRWNNKEVGFLKRRIDDLDVSVIPKSVYVDMIKSIRDNLNHLGVAKS